MHGILLLLYRELLLISLGKMTTYFWSFVITCKNFDMKVKMTYFLSSEHFDHEGIFR